MQESSNLSRMSEHLTNSNILCSRKTYGKKKDYRNLSISNENGGSFSATVSEQLKNNGTSLLSNYSEELYAEENFESVTTVTSNYSENSNIQKDSVVNSEICLFNDEDTDYYFPVSTDSPRDHDSFPSTPEASSCGSNYQRTRKNLKNRLSNQQYGSEETPESTSHEENPNSVNDSKSASNFLNLKQAPSSTKQNYLDSVGSQVEHTKNGIKASDAYVNKLPQNPVLFQTADQAGKIYGKGSMLQNPSKNSSNVLSILDLVSRFTASSNRAPQKTNPCNKRKRIQKECESVPAKKTSIVNHSVSSKVNSVEKKIINSAISIGSYSKSAILKSDVISTVSYQGALKKGDVKSPSKAPKHHHTPKKGNNESVDNMKGSVGVIKSVNNPSVPKKGDVKTPSKAVQKGNNRSVDSTERSIQMLQKYVSKNKTVKDYATTKVKCSSSSSLATSDLRLVRNETAEKIQSGNGDKQIEKPPFVQSEEYTVQNQALNNITEKNVSLNFVPTMPMIIAPNPPISQEGAMSPLYLWVTPSITDNSIQSDNCAVSNENLRDLSIPGPSTLNNDDSSVKTSDFYVKNLCAEETTTTTTTVINQTDIRCGQQKRFFRPRTHLNDGIEFHRFMANGFKNIENNCILKCKEESNQFFSMNPSLLNITVKEFFDTPSLTDVLLDYVNGLDMGKPLAVPNPNKGYDFPENFENENLLRVVKDFVHTAISYMIPANASKPLHISYSRIIKAAMLKMSSREFIVIMQVFKRTGQLFKLKDVCARLSLVALFVIFDEYKNKNRKCR
ncbi:hypothetical protein AVEN_192327-1 [Araneus ventricosus]|uniref:Uncharacterized protein n=1 Tax=Araneus ventricosus TaxID=182803 RepID=A0A4Y2VH56_ARAVE|nr:hypothetical protein AVEN_192327-1 [Araneus ventricosus]